MATKSTESIADELVRDLTEGIEQTGVRAGLIGELGIGGQTAFQGIASIDEVHPDEGRVLEAAALAHRRTGATISIHPPRSRVKGLPRSRLALGVLERLEKRRRAPGTRHPGAPRLQLGRGRRGAPRDRPPGAWVEYDVWGWNDLYWPARRDGFLHDTVGWSS